MDLHEVLRDEFGRRRKRNPRYSLRAYAASLGTHHGTLSRILRRRRSLTLRTIRQMGPRLLTPAQVAEACVDANCAAILGLVRRPGFQPDSRWISIRCGIPLDAVNIAVHRLLHERRLSMPSTRRWIAT